MFLTEELQSYSADERNKWIEKIIAHIQNQGLLQPVVEKSHVELAFKV